MLLSSLIKYEGDNTNLIWKHPAEDFNRNSVLIVHESQEAVFMANGRICEVFPAGRYTLDTHNYPFLSTIAKIIDKGETSYHCEVYFVNKIVQMGLKWGTDSKVRFIEPTMGIPFEIGACGEMNLQVSDSRKLLVKLVGTLNGIAWDGEGAGFTKSLQKKSN